MKKPVLGLVLGGVLGVFDGMTAWVSAPELRPEIMSIVLGSTFKGLVAGVLIGWVATKVRSVGVSVLAGVLISGFFALLIAIMPAANGQHYYWEIILPGAVLGLIVGYATQQYGRADARG
jgi:Na+-transporting NADH:ubiquinone oxidoreductase subunit NqrB